MSTTIFESLYEAMKQTEYAERRIDDLISIQMSRADKDDFGSVCITAQQCVFGIEYEICLEDFEDWHDKEAVYKAYMQAITNTKERLEKSSGQLGKIINEIKGENMA